MGDSFSIIIPVYNTGEKLNDCVRSLQSQTFRDYEVILVDDGSTDNITAELCDQISGKDSRFKVLHSSNGGVAAARNRGFDAVNCEFVMFIDSDDTLFSNTTLQELSELILRYPNVDIVKGGYQRILSSSCKKVIQAENDKLFCNAEDFLEENLKVRYGGFTWNTVYRSSVIKEHRLRMEDSSIEDHIFFLKYLQHIKQAVLTHNILYNYFDTAGSVSYNPKFSAFEILDEALYERNLYLEILSKNNTECMNLINEGLSSNINRALSKLYKFESSWQKRKEFIYRISNIKDFIPALKCVSFPMPFLFRDILLKIKYKR